MSQGIAWNVVHRTKGVVMAYQSVSMKGGQSGWDVEGNDSRF